MTSKNFIGIVLILFSFINSSLQEKPVFNCELSGTTCTFNNVILNTTHYEWLPASDNPTIVTEVKFIDSEIPIFVSGLCDLFPNLRRLDLTRLNVENIKEDAFHACLELEFLVLSSNNIEQFHPNTFSYNKKLATLRLAYNRITELHDDLFLNLENLIALEMEVNNLTEFSAKLLRNNRNLVALLLQTNDLSDIDAETIVKDHPKLEAFTVTDNEIHCTRYVQITNMLRSKGIQVPGGYRLKERYYPTVEVFENYQICIPDIAWMAANYRKQTLNFNQRLDELQVKIDLNFKKMEQKMDSYSSQLTKVDDHRGKTYHEIQEISKIDQLHKDIEKVVAVLRNIDHNYE